jgi:hypothetical protein
VHTHSVQPGHRDARPGVLECRRYAGLGIGLNVHQTDDGLDRQLGSLPVSRKRAGESFTARGRETNG